MTANARRDYDSPKSVPDIHRLFYIRAERWRISVVIMVVWVLFSGTFRSTKAEPILASVDVTPGNHDEYAPSGSTGLSPYWGPEIQQGSENIIALSERYGFHPDFIAAIIVQESSDAEQATGGIPGPGGRRIGSIASEMDWQSPIQATGVPANNLEWGMAILSHVVQETGGDLFTALAAYKSGWNRVDSPSPREFAAGVLESYARALIVRNGISTDTAANWTIAVDLRAGNVPTDSIIVLGNRPLVGLRLMAEHTVYAYTDLDGNLYYVRGFVVPVGLANGNAIGSENNAGDWLDAPLRARLGEKHARIPGGNPRVILACLSSMERLRGQITTRWYSPSTCPEPQR